MKGIRAIVTYNCNIMCNHCSLKCSPLKKGIMNYNEFGKRVSDLYSEGYGDYIIIEGGEVFLHAGKLFKYLKRISHLDMKKYIVTNGFWGDLDPYVDILRDLRMRGMDGIIIEYDYLHSVYIDKDKIINAIRKCLVNRIPVKLRAFFLSVDMKCKEDEMTYSIIKELREEFEGLEVIFESVMQEDFIMPSHRKAWERIVKL